MLRLNEPIPVLGFGLRVRGVGHSTSLRITKSVTYSTLLITYRGSGDKLLHFQKEIDFVAGNAQGSGYGGGRFAAALHT